jgi:hypothetical protein
VVGTGSFSNWPLAAVNKRSIGRRSFMSKFFSGAKAQFLPRSYGIAKAMP